MSKKVLTYFFTTGLSLLLHNSPLSAADFKPCMKEDQVILLNIVPKEESELLIPLPTKNSQSSWVTNAVSTFNFTKADFQLGFSFPLPKGRVSIPYNIYHAQVSTVSESGESMLSHSIDFTDGCRGPGISIFPGGYINLVPIKYPLPEAKNGESLRVQIWGHL